MNSLLYGLALFGVLIILRWYLDNDGNGQNDGSVGLLAMKTTGRAQPSIPAPESKSGKRSFRRKG